MRHGRSRALPLSVGSLFQNWIVPIGDESSAHGFGVFDVGVGANLDAEKFIDGGVTGGKCGILFFLKRVDKGDGVFLAGYGGDLDVVSVGGRGRRG